jgi:hypothetical protein
VRRAVWQLVLSLKEPAVALHVALVKREECFQVLATAVGLVRPRLRVQCSCKLKFDIRDASCGSAPVQLLKDLNAAPRRPHTG